MIYGLIFSLLLISYLIGSIPFGLLIGRYVKKVDVRKFGSKNIGTTNTTRIVGIKWGALVFLLDVLKGAIVIIIVRLLAYYHVGVFKDLSVINNIVIYPIYGLTAVLGHVFSIYLKFKGGKAVATSFGVILAIAPVIGTLGLLVFLIVLVISKYVSLSSMIASLFILIGIFFYDIFFDKSYYWSLKLKYEENNFLIYIVEILVSIILVFIIFIRHKENIQRLLVTKNESKIKFLKKQNICFFKKIK